MDYGLEREVLLSFLRRLDKRIGDIFFERRWGIWDVRKDTREREIFYQKVLFFTLIQVNCRNRIPKGVIVEYLYPHNTINCGKSAYLVKRSYIIGVRGYTINGIQLKYIFEVLNRLLRKEGIWVYV